MNANDDVTKVYIQKFQKQVQLCGVMSQKNLAPLCHCKRQNLLRSRKKNEKEKDIGNEDDDFKLADKLPMKLGKGERVTT